jgi:hypothetical protein
MMRLIRNISFVLLISLLSVESADAQGSDSMSKLLNQVDSPSGWQSAPVSGVPVQGQSPGPITAPGQIVPANSPSAGSPFAAPSPEESPFTIKNIFKTLMSGGRTTPHDMQSALQSVREDLQTARDKEEAAREHYGAIGGERDKEIRMSLAEQARYDADAAREAADRAYNTSCRFNSPDISGIASEARNAANEAQAVADRATAKAGGGW